MKLIPLLIPLLVGCAASSDALALRSASAPMPVPVATEGIELVWEDEDAPGVMDLLNAYAKATGLTVMYTDETRTQIQKHRLRMVGQDKLTVEASDVVAVVESLLAMHQFSLVPLYTGNPTIMQVISLETQERNYVKRSAHFVEPDDLDLYRERAATLITTSIMLPNTDVRTLSNSMRTMLTDANTQQIIPVGNSHGIILTGFGPDVCDLADLIRRIDATQAKAAADAVVEPR